MITQITGNIAAKHSHDSVPKTGYRRGPEAGTSNSVRLHHNLCCNFQAMNEVGQTTAPRLSLQIILWKLCALFWTHFALTTTVTQPPSLTCKRPGWDWSLVSSCSHRLTSANLTLTSKHRRNLSRSVTSIGMAQKSAS